MSSFPYLPPKRRTDYGSPSPKHLDSGHDDGRTEEEPEQRNMHLLLEAAESPGAPTSGNASQEELNRTDTQQGNAKKGMVRAALSGPEDSPRAKNGFARSFPQRLMDVLSRKDTDGAIMWMPDGLAFVIISPRTFVSTVLPRFFKQTKFASFTRKLNRWGFKRVAKGQDAGAYFHKLFRRDNPELCLQMYCKKNDALEVKSAALSGFELSDLQGKLDQYNPLLLQSLQNGSLAAKSKEQVAQQFGSSRAIMNNMFQASGQTPVTSKSLATESYNFLLAPFPTNQGSICPSNPAHEMAVFHKDQGDGQLRSNVSNFEINFTHPTQQGTVQGNVSSAPTRAAVLQQQLALLQRQQQQLQALQLENFSKQHALFKPNEAPQNSMPGLKNTPVSIHTGLKAPPNNPKVSARGTQMQSTAARGA